MALDVALECVTRQDTPMWLHPQHGHLKADKKTKKRWFLLAETE